MDFSNSWTIDSILSLATVVIMAIGAYFALIQWHSATKIKRTEFLDEMIAKLRFDQDMVKTMHTVDYNHDWYNDCFHGSDIDRGTDLEYRIDKLLSYIDYICYLYNMKGISNCEFSVMRYHVNRVCASPSVQAYLWNLYHFSKNMNTDCSFMYIIDYGIKEKIIKNAFKENDKDLYCKYLNF